MNYSRKERLQRGVAQLPVILGLLLIGAALPAALKLVEERTQTQQRAASSAPGCPYGTTEVKVYGECCGCGKAKEVRECQYPNGTKTWVSGDCDHDAPSCRQGCGSSCTPQIREYTECCCTSDKKPGERKVRVRQHENCAETVEDIGECRPVSSGSCFQRNCQPAPTQTPRGGGGSQPTTPPSQPTTPPSQPTIPPDSGPGVTSVPNPGVPSSNCSYNSLQARVQRNSQDPWKKDLEVSQDQPVNLGCMHDGSGNLANNVMLVAEGPVKKEWNTNLVNQWRPETAGTYSIYCVSRDDRCNNLSSGNDSAILRVQGCKLCPDGREIGEGPDYNCDGEVDLSDFSAWYDEFVQGETRYGDFNCDGKTDLTDFSLWYDEYITT